MICDEVTTRLAGEEDEEFLRRLFYIVREPEFRPLQWPQAQLEALLAQQYQAMRSYYASQFPETTYTIFELHGTAIGYEALRVTSEHHLIDIALLPEYRNQGIGTARMLKLQSSARAANHNLILSVELHNPARTLYERLGFVAIDEKGIYLRMSWNATN